MGRRTSEDLLAAFIAGTLAEGDFNAQLAQHQHDLEQRLLEASSWLPAAVPWELYIFAERGGKDYAALRSLIERDLHRKDPSDLRDLLLWTLAALEMTSVRTQRGGQRSGAARRHARTKLLQQTTAIKQQRPALSDDAIARSYLEGQADPKWLAGTDEERQRQVDALTRRIRRARKNSGQELVRVRKRARKTPDAK